MKIKNLLKSVKAFTLIEMLVVVLIIGILAAIAMPQYQKAIIKTDALKLLSAVNQLQKANEAYYLATGKWAYSMTDLDISIPGKTARPHDNIESITNTNQNVTCHLYDDGRIWCYGHYGALYKNPNDRNSYCWSTVKDDYNMCKILGGKEIPRSSNTYILP